VSFGPFFFEDKNGDTETINSVRYLEILKKKFVLALRRRGANLYTLWFQQDGATPLTSRDVIAWLQKTFGTQYISYRTDNVWSPHSLDLSPLYFFLWGYLKDSVYNHSLNIPRRIKNSNQLWNLKYLIGHMHVCHCKLQETIDVVLRQGGRHLEHVLWNCTICVRVNLCKCLMQIYYCYMSNKTLLCLLFRGIFYFNLYFL
jgi:hypothetical protein